MSRPQTQSGWRVRSAGFSLVEMLVALVFISVLMAGMANVFKSSMSTYVKAGEVLGASRRNRMALDMLFDDVSETGLYLRDLISYPAELTAANPGFFVVPNVNYSATGVDPQGTYPPNWAYPASTGDQFYLFFDDPIPFEGTLKTDLQGLGQLEAAGTTVADTLSFNVKFSDKEKAATVKQGMWVIFRDSWDRKVITSAPALVGTAGLVTLSISGNLGVGAYDSPSGTPTGVTALSKRGHKQDRTVVIMNPAQQVRYSIQTRALDPENTATLIPCLVREQGPIGSAFDTTMTSIIAENVIGFKVFISANRGTTWTGMGYTTETTPSGAIPPTSVDSAPWNDTGSTGKFRKVIDAAIAGAAGRTGFKDTTNVNWFREIPILVRIDLLTRTIKKRAEYGNQSPTSPTADYGTRVQTMIIVPRHSGLPLG